MEGGGGGGRWPTIATSIFGEFASSELGVQCHQLGLS